MSRGYEPRVLPDYTNPLQNILISLYISYFFINLPAVVLVRGLGIEPSSTIFRTVAESPD